MKILLFPLFFIPLHAKDPGILGGILSRARKEANIPAVAAIAFDPEIILRFKVIGTTRSDKEIPVAKDAAWHIGSDAKAMTATLMAILIEKTLAKWDTTMAEIFPELAGEFHAKARKTTITQLLSHTAGLPANPEPIERIKSRLAVTKIGLTLEPNEGFSYSNYGYIIAGAVIEKLLDTTWEKAIQKHLFAPLGIKTVDFGAPKGPKAIRGHRNGKPVGTGFFGDNPTLYGPAGGLHLSLSDWVLFCQDHIKGHHGKGKLLKQATYQKLHTPVLKNYALGWGTQSEGGKVTRLSYDGSNTMWYARATLNLESKTGFLITLNTASDEAKEWVPKIAAVIASKNK
jgi:CubicO group peptidase (beta-lactamase class C family)